MKLTGFLDVNGVIGRGIHGEGDCPDAGSLLKKMDSLGIGRSLVWSLEARDSCPMTGNRRLVEEIASKEEFRRRLIPSPVVTPANVFERGAVDELRRTLSGGLRAIRIFPKQSGFSLRCIERLMETLRDLRPIVLCRMLDSDPQQCAELARKFPDMRFILCETMWREFTSALDLMWRSSNILMDISWLHMRGAIRILCEEFGAHRVVFGTGFKSHYGAAIAGLRYSGISRKDMELVAHGSMERALPD